ncbi:hypothetical protein JIG36_22890 [Actinoplanes sp. LDG1-06]|uniref:Uncharacterized protein n=1 Tax=Paractinoplanes ovalisporus TaxID=2810368 RepID=A0ABS2AGN9_9ACTN|nr:hypothetical protein [Actinoplanes ovalisporus]MBM2618411.1 hypothetical protein [Actinoplanes ovalisporus]
MKTVSRRLALWRSDLEAGVCAAPEECEAEQRARVVIEHRPQGGAATRAEFDCDLRQDVEWQFDGLTWPADIPPGTFVTVEWHARKNEAVIRTALLEEPLTVDGVEYWHEYDPKVVTRDSRADKSNRSQVLHAVRKLGRVFDDGSAVLTEELLARRAGLGRGQKGAFLLRNAIDQLIREGFLTRVTGSVDSAGHPSYPPLDGQATADMVFYAPMVEPIPTESHRGEHWVTGFIRKLPRGAQPTQRQLDLYHQASQFQDIGPLEPGYTFVQKHHRNG